MIIKLKNIEAKYMKELIDLLQDISNFKPNNSEYKSIYDSFIAQNDVIGVVALVKHNKFSNERVVGFGSLHMSKRIRGGVIGFIEDVAVNENFRKKGIGELIIKELMDKAREKKCFKLVLQCKEVTKTFYQKIGFTQSGNSMSIFL